MDDHWNGKDDTRIRTIDGVEYGWYVATKDDHQSTGEIRSSMKGLNYSPTLVEQLKFKRTSLICYVAVSGEERSDGIFISGSGIDGVVDRFYYARRRETIACGDCAVLMHTFACDVADLIMDLHDFHHPFFRGVIKAKRAWIRGDCSDDRIRIRQRWLWDRYMGEANHACWKAAENAIMLDPGEAAGNAARLATWNSRSYESEFPGYLGRLGVLLDELESNVLARIGAKK